MYAHFFLLNTKLLTWNFITPLLLLLLLSLHFHLTVTATDHAKLVDAEVETLKIIGAKLWKTDWDFSVDPCSKKGNWSIKGLTRSYESSVTCDCSYNNYTVCHIVRIALKSQNISGIIPPEFSRLPYLENLDLSRNVFTGSIPSEWATMRLTDLSLMTNSLSGPFPMVITKISTLVNLSLEGNSFSGPIPSEIGNLNLELLHLMSNFFSGALPAGLANLTNLIDLRLSGNNFSGQIPNFLGNWKKIKILQIQGNSLDGPLPYSISALTYLTDLRISDLKGGPSPFPDLRKTYAIKILILRNCLLYGTIPEYIGRRRGIRLLDLSYNNLTGVIPSSFEYGLNDYLYLTGNNLSGSLPRWLLERSKSTDLSENNFTWAGLNECIQGAKVNLAESFLHQQNTSVHSCYEKYNQCSSTKNYGSSLHINCGGDQVTINDTTYQADMAPRGASSFYPMPNWALSSTGNFMDIGSVDSVYIINSTSALSYVSEPLDKLYTSARASPLSVTYYGLCLFNGPYFVKLHFAELFFSNDNTFARLGRRIFDVYIQGELVLKDFDIVREAGGSGRPFVKSFLVNVTDHTLKIHLYWAAKGTTGVPVKGVYGPLISAIAIDPDFIPPQNSSQKGENKNIYVVAGSVFVALLFILAFVVCVLRRKGYLRWKLPKEQELIGRDLVTGLFTLPQLKAATNNFDSSNKLGEGGFGAVYKGKLSDGTLIAVKQLSTKSRQGSREFITEIGMISSLQHPNLVRLYGCCAERDQLLLIYEYMENNCLSRALFGSDKALKLKLNWPTRQKICLGIARGLRYLHEESIVKIVHRDIKTSNVLLDKELNAKISDFGLAKLNEGDNVQVSTRVAGTVGYMAPEYAMRGHLSSKADVYSFGVVALEIVSGKSNTDYIPAQEFVYLLDWANVLQEKGNLLELVDPDLGSDYCSEDALVLLKVALLCTDASPSLRPTMSQVISILEGETDIQDHLSDNPSSTNDLNYRSLGTHFWEGESQVISGSAMSIPTDTSSVAYDRDDIHKPLKFYSAPD